MITFNDKYDDLSWFLRYRASTTTITTVYAGGADRNFDLFTDTAAVGDAVVFGAYQLYGQFNELRLNIDVALAATSITGVWEYADTNSGFSNYAAITWTALSGVTDGTNSFQNTGSNSVTFTVPDNWANFVQPDSTTASYYNWYIRFRITAITGVTEGGHVLNANDSASVKYYAIHPDNSYTSSAPLTFQAIYDADVVGGWGVVTKNGSSYSFNADLTSWYNIYLSTKQETITFLNNKALRLRTGNGWELHAGEIYSGDKVKNGSTFIFLGKAVSYPSNNVLAASSEVYNTQFRHDKNGVAGSSTYFNGYWGMGLGSNSSQKIADVYIENFRNLAIKVTSNVGKDIKFFGGKIEPPGGIVDNVTCFGGNYSVRTAADNKGHYIHNSDFSGAVVACVNPWYASDSDGWVMDFVNCKWGIFTDTNRVRWTFPNPVTYSNAVAYETYSVLLKILDEKGNAIQNASVGIYNNVGTEIFNYTTNSDGVAGVDSGTATSATVNTITDTAKSWSTDQWWFRELLITGGTGVGARRIVKKGNTATVVTSHFNYEVTPDNTSRYIFIPYVQVKKYIPTAYTAGDRLSTVTDYNPFTLIVKKTGYETLKQAITITSGIDWSIKLKRSRLEI